MTVARTAVVGALTAVLVAFTPLHLLVMAVGATWVCAGVAVLAGLIGGRPG